MINIRPYTPEDESRLLPFLHAFNPGITDELWRSLLNYSWKNEEGFSGMLMESEGRIAGFLGYVISSGINNGAAVQYCNLSSWIVSPAFRSGSMKLLSPAFGIRHGIILNLSPHERTRPVFRALRFEMLAEYEYRINPFRLQFAMRKEKKKAGIRCRRVNAGMPGFDALSAVQQQMIRDHAPYANVCFYSFEIKAGDGPQMLLLAFNRKKLKISGLKSTLKELPYTLLGKTDQAELLYSSSSALLAGHFSEIMLSLIRAEKVRSLNVSENFVAKKELQLPYTIKSTKDCPWFWYSGQPVNTEEIHILYTEKVLLNF